MKQVKYSPRQTSFDTSGYNNILDFTVESGTYDLSDSWININCQVNATSNVSVGGDTSCVFDSTILSDLHSETGYDFLVDNTHDGIVKNIELSSGNKGVIETRVNHNAFKANMNAIIRDDEDNQNETHGSTLDYQSKGLVQHGPINLLNGLGTASSEIRACNIRLPLKNLLGCGSITNFNTSQMGNLKLHCELELQRLAASTSENALTKEYNGGVDSGNNAKYGEMADIAVAGDVTKLTTKIKYNDVNDHPFWIDQQLKAAFDKDSESGLISTIAPETAGSSDKVNQFKTGVATTVSGSGGGSGCTLDYTVNASGAIIFSSMVVNAPGTGYTVDDILTIQSSGTKDSKIKVLTVNTGAVDTFEENAAGASDKANEVRGGVATTVASGSGAGCTVNYTVKADRSIDMTTIAVSAKGTGYAVDDILTIQSSGTKNTTIKVTALQPAQTANIKIKEIEQKATGELELTLTETMVTPATKVEDIVLEPISPNTSPIQINNIELVMAQLDNAPKASQKVQFDSISTHRETFPPGIYSSQTHFIPPMTKCVWITFPEPGNVYSKEAIDNYRITIDNEAITDRVITYGSQLHNDLMARAIMNSGNKRIKNMGAHLRNFNFPNDGSNDSLQPLCVIGFPVEFKNAQQLLELELNASSAMKGLIQLNYERVVQM